MPRLSKTSSKPSSIADNVHWTAQSTDNFLHRITFDFVQQVEHALVGKKENQAALATKLGLTEGRVSQTLNNPSSMSLRTIVKYARAVGKKVAVVLYDDSDPANSTGPINSEIFFRCWEQAGRPRDFFELETATTAENTHYIVLSSLPISHSRWYSHDYQRGMLSTGDVFGPPFIGTPVFISGEARRVIQ
jgi:hypothetical protein